MKYALVFRPEVRDDLSDVYRWYETQQSGLGDEFIDCVDELLNRICLMPESYVVSFTEMSGGPSSNDFHMLSIIE